MTDVTEVVKNMDRHAKAKLVAASVKGDTDAFSKLYGEVYKQLYYYALANLRCAEDAADAVQDAVLDAFAEIAELKKASAFDSWLFKILSAKIKKKQKEYAERRYDISEPYSSAALIKETADFERCEILDGFADLSENERLCITLSCIAGYKGKEISEITGINQSTVRSCISRGRTKLRAGLNMDCKEVTE